jgi:ATP-dependent helicase Lhr and Lhr-like helicase
VNAVDRLHPVIVHHIVNTLGWPSLRPLQKDAIEPLLASDDALLIAPTAGGKTEAAVFPLLSAMATQGWPGTSVLYVCPLRALLNNLEPRLSGYASWVGRQVGLWHGDTGASRRQRLLADPPDLLLTTPESLEAMLVSTRVDPRLFFRHLRAVVVDEVHAFAGDDRGWHLLAVLERLQRLAGRPLQRVGLSATVGNPDSLLAWLQGSAAKSRQATVIASKVNGVNGPDADVTLDYVGSLSNAATVVSSLHRGEKRLVFCESRRHVEELAVQLRERGVTTFVSHSSLAVDERRRAEQAFAEARDCVIVSTSTLELGIDVGDLDHVIQIDAPRTVASFLQRLGRTGRRPGTERNALLLATSADTLIHAAGLLKLWSSGWVEPVTPPPSPRHLVAQQLLGLCLQEHRIGDKTWTEWLGPFEGVGEEDIQQIVEWLLATGHLNSDGGMLFIGPEAERRYGRRHFMDLVSVFTADPEFTVLAGRKELGTVDPVVLTRRVDGQRIVILAGRAWDVTHIDWKRHRCWVAEAKQRGRIRWQGQPQPLSFELCQARRDILLGDEPGVRLTDRATTELGAERKSAAHVVRRDGTVVDSTGPWWWTWAGSRANATIAAAVPEIIDARSRYENDRLRLRGDVGTSKLNAAIATADIAALPSPDVDPAAIRGLKFAESLPPNLARRTLSDRLADPAGARAALLSKKQWVTQGGAAETS